MFNISMVIILLHFLCDIIEQILFLPFQFYIIKLDLPESFLFSATFWFSSLSYDAIYHAYVFLHLKKHLSDIVYLIFSIMLLDAQAR